MPVFFCIFVTEYCASCGLGRHYKVSVFAPESLQSAISSFSAFTFKIERKNPTKQPILAIQNTYIYV